MSAEFGTSYIQQISLDFQQRIHNFLKSNEQDDSLSLVFRKITNKFLNVNNLNQILKQLRMMIKPEQKIYNLMHSLLTILSDQDLANVEFSSLTNFIPSQEQFLSNVTSAKINHTNYINSCKFYSKAAEIGKLFNLKKQQETSNNKALVLLLEEIIPQLQAYVLDHFPHPKPSHSKRFSQEDIKIKKNPLPQSFSPGHFTTRKDPDSKKNRLDQILCLKVKKPAVQSIVKKYKHEMEDSSCKKSARTQIDEKQLLLSEIEKKNQEIKNLKREEMNIYWQIEREAKQKQKIEEKSKESNETNNRYKSTERQAKVNHFSQPSLTRIKNHLGNKENVFVENDEMVRLRDELASRNKQKEEIEQHLMKTLKVINQFK